MTSITTRSSKGSALTHDQMDQNLNNLNNDKLEASDIKGSTGVTVSTDTAGDPNISIGQSVGTGDNVQFNQVTASLVGNVTGTASSIANHDTGDLSEGSNLYFTTARARASISASGSLSYNSSTGALTYTQAAIDADSTTVSNLEVDNLKSGVLDTDISSVAGTDTTLASAKAIKTYVDAQIATKDNTDEITEGSTNLYFTNARADARVQAASINDLSDVDTSGIAVGQVLAFDSAGQFVATTQSGGLSNIVEDTTPQLGGDLDVNGAQIVSTGGGATGDIDLVSSGEILLQATTDVWLSPGASNQIYLNSSGTIFLGQNNTNTRTLVNRADGAILKLMQFTDGDSAKIELQTQNLVLDPNTGSGTRGDIILDGLKWPQADGSAGQYLKTDGSAQLSWDSIPSSDVVSDTTPQLGGNLDVNGQSIVSTSNGNITIAPNGNGIILLEGPVRTSSGSFTISDTLAVDITSGGTRHTEFTNASATGSGFQATLGTGGQAHTSGNHYVYRTSTASGFATRATLAGDGTHTFEADSSAHGDTLPLVLKSTNSGYNRPQLRFNDAGNSQADIVVRKTGNSQMHQLVFDTAQDTPYNTGDSVGDYAHYILRDGDNDRINTQIYGANDKHIYSVFAGGSGSYATKPMEINASKITLPRTIENDTSAFANTVAELTSTDNGYGRSQLSLKSSDSKGEVHIGAIGGSTGAGHDVGGVNIFLDVGSTPQSGDAAGDYLHQIRFNQTQNRQEWNVYGANNGFNLGVFKGNSGSYGYAELQVDAGNIDLNANGATTIDTTEFTVNSSGAITLNADSDSSGNELFKLQESGTDVLSFNRGPGGDAELVFKGDAIFIKNASDQTLFAIDDSGTTQGVTGFNPDRTKAGVLALKRNDSTTTYNGTYTFRVDANERKFFFEITDDVGSDGTTEIFSVEDSAGVATATPKDIVKFAIPPVLPSFTVANLPTTVVAGAQAFCTNDTGGAVPVFFDGTSWRRCTDRAVAST